MIDSNDDKATRGRPRVARHEVRANRVVTFITDAEFDMLETLAMDDERSLSAVVYGIVTQYFRGADNENR